MRKYLNNLCFLCFFLCSSVSLAQNTSTDLAYLVQKDSSATTTIKAPKRSLLIRFNPLYLFLNGSLVVYQKVISPQFSANCLFELSCSRFSQAAIQEYGFLKGLALTADRLARCNRISATTINPFRVNQQGKVIDSPKMYKSDQ